jgi:hypothetical protein
LPNNVLFGDSQSQSQAQSNESSGTIQVPGTNPSQIPHSSRDRAIIDESTQIEDSQPFIENDVSLSEASESDLEDDHTPLEVDKTYTGFIDRAAQKRASRTISQSSTRLAFKAVLSSSPARVKRTAVSVIEADDEATRKRIMKEVVESKNNKRKAWGTAKGRGAVTFRAKAKGKENVDREMSKKGGEDTEKRKRNMLALMDSQNSFC